MDDSPATSMSPDESFDQFHDEVTPYALSPDESEIEEPMNLTGDDISVRASLTSSPLTPIGQIRETREHANLGEYPRDLSAPRPMLSVDPTIVARIKAHQLFPALEVLHHKVQLAMECTEEEEDVYDINDVTEIIAALPRLEEDDDEDEISALLRSSLLSHALCLRELFHAVDRANVFFKAYKRNLIERAPLQHCWKRAGEEDEEEEDEEGSPVTTPLENDLLMDFLNKAAWDPANIVNDS